MNTTSERDAFIRRLGYSSVQELRAKIDKTKYKTIGDYLRDTLFESESIHDLTKKDLARIFNLDESEVGE